MRKFRVTVDGKTYEVEVEELGGKKALPKTAAAMPAEINPAPMAAPAPQPARAPESVQSNEPKGNDNVGASITGAGTPVEAPVTGQIIRVEVKPGEAVEEGQVLLILEAMKMENEVTAPISGTVGQIAVNSGQTVTVGAAMLFIKP
ncbi:MAG: biotin/lipoyl-containing protein [Bacillota bacterium]|nr:biotin/lipoyl-containing protein [Bacillota bacterium]